MKEKAGSREVTAAKPSASRPRKIVDADGVEVKAGCIVHFGYGIPPVGVRASVVERDGKLIVLTPEHNPKSCRADKLASYVGDFWVVG